jgi:hypothetical protein
MVALKSNVCRCPLKKEKIVRICSGKAGRDTDVVRHRNEDTK